MKRGACTEFDIKLGMDLFFFAKTEALWMNLELLILAYFTLFNIWQYVIYFEIQTYVETKHQDI